MTETITTPEPPLAAPKLKEGAMSTEYQGKLVLQSIMGILAVVNAILQQFGREPIMIDAETAALAATALEAMWMTYRQLNKGLEVRAQRDVEVARVVKEPKV